MFPDMPAEPLPSIENALNRFCHCVTMDDALLNAALAKEGASFGAEQLVASHPNLFSRVAVFVSTETRTAMQGVISALERVVALPAYRELALAEAHAHARVSTGARGAFLGVDFHLSDDGPKVIEINTNPGGGLLNAVLRNAQRACCEPVADALRIGEDELAAGRFLAMFKAEHERARPGAELRRVAIVDDDPLGQYLYPELVLFRRLFETAGIEAVIADARELEVSDGALRYQAKPIDLVYNRLTDFELARPEHAALARAYTEKLAVVTPHPEAYALYADKRRLITLSDGAALRELGASVQDAELLARHVPATVRVTPDQHQRFWAERKQWFFKPEQGYGGKAAYRGDKLTKSTFERLITERYVAQRIVPPSARVITVDGEERALKLDVRCFAYEADVQLVCARLYEGQTTNFRTAGGGFAPVYVV
jgi:glutathione synthase/RimK-type ligase-like ATP-grasp enzyme